MLWSFHMNYTVRLAFTGRTSSSEENRSLQNNTFIKFWWDVTWNFLRKLPFFGVRGISLSQRQFLPCIQSFLFLFVWKAYHFIRIRASKLDIHAKAGRTFEERFARNVHFVIISWVTIYHATVNKFMYAVNVSHYSASTHILCFIALLIHTVHPSMMLLFASFVNEVTAYIISGRDPWTSKGG